MTGECGTVYMPLANDLLALSQNWNQAAEAFGQLGVRVNIDQVEGD